MVSTERQVVNLSEIGKTNYIDCCYNLGCNCCSESVEDCVDSWGLINEGLSLILTSLA